MDRQANVITSNVATYSDGSGDCQTSRLKNCPARKQLSELGHSDFRPPVLVTLELPNLKIGRLLVSVKTSLPQTNFQIPGYPNFLVQVKTSDLSAMISASPATPASKSFGFLPPVSVKTSLPQTNFQIPGYPNFLVQVKTSDLSAMISASPAIPASKSFSFLPWLFWILMAMLQHLCKNSPIC